MPDDCRCTMHGGQHDPTCPQYAPGPPPDSLLGVPPLPELEPGE